MPFGDVLLNFVDPAATLSMVGTASRRSSIYDFAGVGAGNAPPNIFGNATLFGQPDAQGIGLMRMELDIKTGSAAWVGANVTLNVALQYAADLGSSTYQPDTWITVSESGAIAVSRLTAYTTIFRTPMLMPFPENLRPRFASLLFTSAGGTFTTGVIGSARQVPGRDDLANRYQPNNFHTAL